MKRTLVLDSGALIGIERRSARLQSLMAEVRNQTVSLVVPTMVVAQVVRPGGRQANLRRFLADPYLRFSGVDYQTALEIGALLGESDTNDVVDAGVVVCARRADNCAVVTSDPSDIALLDSRLPLIEV